MIPITNRSDLQQRRFYALEALEQRYFLSAGFLDPGFGENGIVLDQRIVSADYNVNFATVIQSDGKILVGATNGYDQRLFIVRYKRDGSIDKSFSGDGLVEGKGNFVTGLVQQADGKILVATDDGVMRLNANGSMDEQFGDHGVVASDEWWISTMLLQRSGKIVLAVEEGGTWHWWGELRRLNEDGSVDETFGSSGSAGVCGDPDDWSNVDGLREMPDGGILAVVDTYADENAYCLQKFSVDGQEDESFGDGSGAASTVVPLMGDESIENLQVTPSGDLVFATGGGFDERVGIYRYSASGKPEGIFGRSGITIHGPVDPWATDMMRQRDGKMVLVSFGPELAASRYTADGSIDPTFGQAGISMLGLKSWDGGVVAREDNDGGVILVGSYRQKDGSQILMLARLTSDSDPTPPPRPEESSVGSDAADVASINDEWDWGDEESLFSNDESDPLGTGDMMVWD